MSRRVPVGTKCCVKTCGNCVDDTSNVEFHRFPTDLKARKKWCDAVNLNMKLITNKHVICDAHFPDDMFTLSVSKTLNEWAVPKLVQNDEEDSENYEIVGDVYETIETIDENNKDAVFLEIQCVTEEFSCDMCTKTFYTREDRNNHISDHFKTYTCNVCNKTLIGDRQFEHHRLAKKCTPKKNVNSITYECFLCHKGNFFSIRALRIHFNRLHNPKKGADVKQICEYCQKSFANIYILKSHISQIHVQGQQFVCTECGKTFNRESNLKCVMFVHL